MQNILRIISINFENNRIGIFKEWSGPITFLRFTKKIHVMIISVKHKYIYMAVPKTGTTSVQKFLLENDKTASKNKAEIDGRAYRFREHMTAQQIKNVLQEKYDDFRVIGFVRDPYSRLVSGYHFYKQGAKYWIYQNSNKKRKFDQKLKIKFAKLVPFKIWALIYPYKSNNEYFFDDYGKMIVDMTKIGLFENLEQDFHALFKSIDVHWEESIPHLNKSNHNLANKYFKNGFFRFLINKKVGKDLSFYNKIANKIR